MNNSLFIGIDPGQAGAIAAIDNNMNIFLLEDWPGDEVQAAKIVNTVKLHTDINKLSIHAAIEKVSAMPKQGVTSMFKFGANYGIWKGILAAKGIPFQEVSPQAWQKGIVSKARDKSPSIATAGRLFPKAELFGPRGGKKDGRSDALLIAYFCMMQIQRKVT